MPGIYEKLPVIAAAWTSMRSIRYVPTSLSNDGQLSYWPYFSTYFVLICSDLYTNMTPTLASVLHLKTQLRRACASVTCRVAEYSKHNLARSVHTDMRTWHSTAATCPTTSYCRTCHSHRRDATHQGLHTPLPDQRPRHPVSRSPLLCPTPAWLVTASPPFPQPASAQTPDPPLRPSCGRASSVEL
eukprot:55133-Eustigmatos_ZCMA.PRE.1